MAQQTAVEWIIDQLRQLSHSLEAHLGTGDIRVTQGMIDELEEQAKQMEKDKEDLYLEFSEWLNTNQWYMQNSLWYNLKAEGACASSTKELFNYYKETYNK